jgi:copper(I)-binding protein
LPEVKNIRALAPIAGLALALSLAACQQSKAPVAAETGTAEAVSNGPDAKPGITASNGRLIAPVVSGRPAAAYFTVGNDGPATATLVGVHVEGAGEAQMHKTEGGKMTAVESVDIAPGASIEFAPGGYHVMVFDLADNIKAGGTTELTLTFSDGDKLSLPMKVEAMGAQMNAGGNMDDMAGMQH